VRLANYKIEYQTGKVQMIQSNILVQDVKDMQMIEFWEERLRRLNQPFMVVYRKVGGSVFYSIFTDLRKKGSAFR
jgi:hypothetical protein